MSDLIYKENNFPLFFRAPVTQESTSILLVIIICLAIFLTLIICAVVAYGFTPSGKRTYKKLYLYYFGKPVDYEKRWRYSVSDFGSNLIHLTISSYSSIELTGRMSSSTQFVKSTRLI